MSVFKIIRNVKYCILYSLDIIKIFPVMADD